MAMQRNHNTASTEFTPPGSFTEPLTPPPTDSKPSKRVTKILQRLRLQESGRDVLQNPWFAVKLEPSEYNELLQLLKNNESLRVFREAKLRYDYDSANSLLVIRMPTQKHDVFVARVVDLVQNRLRAVIEGGETQSSSFAQKIKHNGSGRLIFRTAENGKQYFIERQPDAEFKHEDARWPGVIIEVSYSQKTRVIPHLADDYILETNGSIRVVVGLDLDYRTKKATVTIWRPQYVTNANGDVELEAAQVDCHIFRDELGNAKGGGLRLELKDFAPQVLARDCNDAILIDAVALCGCLDEAEKAELESNQTKGFVENLQHGAKKRRRARTPPEELYSEDEHKFEDDERNVRARLSADDTSYKPSGTE